MRTKAGLEQAVEYFRQAIERDSGFAIAYSGLADAYLLLGSYGHMPHAEACSKAKAAAERALDLDETLAEAHASRGQVLGRERNWRGQEEEYRRAVELNPSYATGRQWYAMLLSVVGRPDEALREIRRAEELDPLSHAIGVTVGVVLFLARDYDGALEQLKKTLELEPNFASTHAWLGIVYAQKGRYEEASRAVGRAIELNPDNPSVLAGLAYAHARSGHTQKAIELLNEVRERGGAGWTGAIYAALGDKDRAFETLELAFEEPQLLRYLKVFPWYDPLRSDPRFDDLLRRMGFPQ